MVGGYSILTVNDAVSAGFSSWRGARGHGTADLLTEENDNHDLRGKRMPMLQLIKTAETEQSDGFYISSNKYRMPASIMISGLLFLARLRVFDVSI